VALIAKVDAIAKMQRQRSHLQIDAVFGIIIAYRLCMVTVTSSHPLKKLFFKENFIASQLRV
jgi:hypothetical protein